MSIPIQQSETKAKAEENFPWKVFADRIELFYDREIYRFTFDSERRLLSGPGTSNLPFKALEAARHVNEMLSTICLVTTQMPIEGSALFEGDRYRVSPTTPLAFRSSLPILFSSALTPLPSPPPPPSSSSAILPPPSSNGLELDRTLLEQAKLPYPFDPNLPPISQRMIGHLFGDAFISNQTVGHTTLEGASHQEMLSLLAHFLNFIEAKKELPKNWKNLKNMIAGALAFSESLQKFQEEAQAKEILPEQTIAIKKRFAEFMLKMLFDMPQGKSILIPSGWVGARSEGHAIYLLIHKSQEVSDSYDITAFNTGDGIEFHSEVISLQSTPKGLDEKTKIVPFVKALAVPFKQIGNPLIWQAYFELSMFRPASVFENHDARPGRSFYVGFLKALSPNFNSCTDQGLLVKQQIAAICAAKSLNAYCKNELGEREWISFKHNYRTYILNNYCYQLKNTSLTEQIEKKQNFASKLLKDFKELEGILLKLQAYLKKKSAKALVTFKTTSDYYGKALEGIQEAHEILGKSMIINVLVEASKILEELIKSPFKPLKKQFFSDYTEKNFNYLATYLSKPDPSRDFDIKDFHALRAWFNECTLFFSTESCNSAILEDTYTLMHKVLEKYSRTTVKRLEEGTLTKQSSQDALQLIHALSNELSRIKIFLRDDDHRKVPDLSILETLPTILEFPDFSEIKEKAAESELKVREETLYISLEIPESLFLYPHNLNLDLLGLIERAGALKTGEKHLQAHFLISQALDKLPPADISDFQFWSKVEFKERENALVNLASLSQLFFETIYLSGDVSKQPTEYFHIQKIYAIMQQLFLNLRGHPAYDGLIGAIKSPFHTHHPENFSTKSGFFFTTTPNQDESLTQTLQFLNQTYSQDSSKKSFEIFFNYSLLAKNDADNSPPSPTFIEKITKDVIKEKGYQENAVLVSYLQKHPEVAKRLFEYASEKWACKDPIAFRWLIALAKTDLEGKFLPKGYCAFKQQYFLLESFAIGTPISSSDKFYKPYMEIQNIPTESVESESDPRIVVYSNMKNYRDTPKKPHNFAHFDSVFECDIVERWEDQDFFTLFQTLFIENEKVSNGNFQNQTFVDPKWKSEEFRKTLALGCRDDRALQVIKTMAFFEQNPLLLRQNCYRDLCTCLLLERGILREQLENAPHTAQLCVDFYKNGFEYFFSRNLIFPALFYFRMGLRFDASIAKAAAQKIEVNAKGCSDELFSILMRSTTDKNLPQLKKRHLYVELLSAYSDRTLSKKEAFEVVRLIILHNEGEVGKKSINSTPSYIYEKKNGALYKAWAVLFRESKKDKKGFFEEFGKYLNEIIHEIHPELTSRSWISKDFTLFTTTDDEMEFDFSTGILTVHSMRSNLKIPASLTSFLSDLDKDLTIKNFKSNRHHCLFQDQFEFTVEGIKTDSWEIRKRVEGQLYQLRDHSYKHPLLRSCSAWYGCSPNAQEVLFFNKKLYYRYHVKTQLIRSENGPLEGLYNVNQDDCLNDYSFFEKFAGGSEYWKDSRGEIQVIELSCNLTFRREGNGKKFASKEWPGFFLATDQQIPLLANLENYLVIENARGEKKVLIRENRLVNYPRREFNRISHVKTSTSITCSTAPLGFDWSKKKQELIGQNLKENLFLLFLFIEIGNNEKAHHLLKYHTKKLHAYSEKEMQFFQSWIFERENTDADIDHSIVKLLAFHQLTQNLETFSETFSINDEKLEGHVYQIAHNFYENYLEKINHATLPRLTREQEIDILNTLKQQKKIIFSTTLFVRFEILNADSEEIDAPKELLRSFSDILQVSPQLWERAGNFSAFILSLLSGPNLTPLTESEEKEFFSNNHLSLTRPFEEQSDFNPYSGEKRPKKLEFLSLYQLAKNPQLSPENRENLRVIFQLALSKISIEAQILLPNILNNPEAFPPLEELLKDVKKKPNFSILSPYGLPPRATKNPSTKLCTLTKSFQPFFEKPSQSYLNLYTFDKKIHYSVKASKKNKTPKLESNTHFLCTPLAPLPSLVPENLLYGKEGLFVSEKEDSINQLQRKKNQEELIAILQAMEKNQKEAILSSEIHNICHEVLSLKLEKEWQIDLQRLPGIQKLLFEDAENAERNLAQLEERILKLSNKEPLDFNKLLIRKLQVISKEYKPLTISTLALHYARKNFAACYHLNECLSSQDLMALEKMLTELFNLEVQQQQRKRALECIDKFSLTKNFFPSLRSEGDEKTRVEFGQPAQDRDDQHLLIQELHKELTGKSCVNPLLYPEELVFQYFSGILLRKDQTDAHEKMISGIDGHNFILQRRMGSGKSKVLLPLLALRLADGENLVCIVVPDELIEDISQNMLAQSGEIFHQLAHKLDWNNTTFEGLENIEYVLTGIKEKKEFLLVTCKELHLFALRARALRIDLTKPEDFSSENLTKERERLTLFREILKTLKESGLAIMDEVDLLLDCRHEVHISYGKVVPLEKSRLDLAWLLLEVMFLDPYFSKKYRYDAIEKGAEQTFTPKLFKEFKLPFVRTLLEKLRNHARAEESDLDGIIKTLGLNLEGRNTQELQITQYLLDDGSENGDFLIRLNPDQRDGWAYLREALRTMELTLSKNYNEHYGFFPGNENILAGPYAGSKQPKIGSEFGNYRELILYTIQAYFFKGIPDHLLIKEIEKLKNVSSRDSQAAIAFAKLSKSSPKYKLNTMNGKDLLALCAEINQDKERILFFVRTYILPTITCPSKRISSQSEQLVEMFSKVKAFSGTLHNHETYPSKMKVEFEAGLDGLTWLSVGKECLIVESSEPFQFLKELDRQGIIAKSHAIIDVGAYLKDFPENQLFSFLSELEGFKKREHPINSVVNYVDNEQMMHTKTTSSAYIKGQFSPLESFTIYDQKHCTGSDIPQGPSATAIVTINKNIKIRDLVQAVWRMRRLDKGQKLIFCLSKKTQEVIQATLQLTTPITVVDLMQFALKNQTNQVSDDNYLAVKHKMHHAIYQVCDSILSEVSDKNLSLNFYKDLEALNVTLLDDSPYKQYGKVASFAPARSVLEQYKENCLIKIKIFIIRYAKIIAEKLDAVIIQKERKEQKINGGLSLSSNEDVDESEDVDSEDFDDQNNFLQMNKDLKLLNALVSGNSSLSGIIEDVLNRKKPIIASYLQLQLDQTVESTIEQLVETEKEAEKETDLETALEQSQINSLYANHGGGKKAQEKIDFTLIFDRSYFFRPGQFGCKKIEKVKVSGLTDFFLSDHYTPPNLLSSCSFSELFNKVPTSEPRYAFSLMNSTQFCTESFLLRKEGEERETKLNFEEEEKRISEMGHLFPSTSSLLSLTQEQNFMECMAAQDCLGELNLTNYSKLSHLFSPQFHLSKEYRYTINNKQEPFSFFQKPLNTFLVIQDKSSNQVNIVLISANEVGQLQRFLAQDRKQPLKIKRDQKICLYHPDKCVVQQGSDPIDMQWLERNQSFKTLLVQARFFNGEIFYKHDEKRLLKEWLGSQPFPESVEKLFTTLMIKWQFSFRKLYSSSYLPGLFNSLTKTPGILMQKKRSAQEELEREEKVYADERSVDESSGKEEASQVKGIVDKKLKQK